MIRPEKNVRKKAKKEASAFTFVVVTALAFGLMISYVWLNNEVTSTLNSISALHKELALKKTAGKLLEAEIASLSRADRITNFAKENLNMIFPPPQFIKLAAKPDINILSSYGEDR